MSPDSDDHSRVTSGSNYDVSADPEKQDGKGNETLTAWEKLCRRLPNWCKKFPASDSTLSPMSSTECPPGPMGYSDYHVKAIEELFGQPKEFAFKFPGILIFCRHLETRFQRLQVSERDAIQKVLKKAGPLTVDDFWDWCFKVLKAFNSLEPDKITIENAYSAIILTGTKDIVIGVEEKRYVLRAIFAVLCWTSGTLVPLIKDESSMLEAKNIDQLYSVRTNNDLLRPLDKLFQKFRYSNEDVRSSAEPRGGTVRNARSSSDDTLYESSLNYFTLSTIGGIEIQWVDTITAHLAFDLQKRTLSIFRFPSFCIANVFRHSDIKALECVTTGLLPPHRCPDSAAKPGTIHLEILSSYRLLFGQSSRLGKLVDELHEHYSRSLPGNGPPTNQDLGDADFSAVFARDVDPFLKAYTLPISQSRYFGLTKLAALPKNIFPSSDPERGIRIRNPETHSASRNFPVYGPRLCQIQEFITSQRPNKVTGLWYDRRNLLQWYTFWAVLWIGGLGILLSLSQLVVGIVQVYLSTHAPQV
ncbi:hypothetical protein F5Y04DRAFT_292512 [Hypomontagnella monticulosa]|nr:hypothetical protein F5Y04DRAFT_292512 [Hypomontagnella monticulosa]